jgi:hypothetical protein
MINEHNSQENAHSRGIYAFEGWGACRVYRVVPIVPKICMPDGSEFLRSLEWIYELAPGIESIPDLIVERVRQDQPNITRAADIAAACK